MREFSLLLFFIATLHTSFAQTSTEPVIITDMLKIKTISNITLTKDGTKAAFTVTSIEADQKNTQDYKYSTQIYSASTSKTTAPVQLTTSKEDAIKPVWSPDGKQLAFTR